MDEELSRDILNFEQADFGDGPQVSLVCANCGQAPAGSYYSVNGQPTCSPCLEEAKLAKTSSFLKALSLGTCAGAVGALVYYGIREVTGYDLALITVVLGVVVGIGVRMGAGGSTSMLYRLMAVALTWTAMCATYVPGIAEDPEVGGYVAASLVALAAPVFLAMEVQVLGIIIFGFGLWEAWSKSAPSPFEVQGPFEMAAAQVPADDGPKILTLPTQV